MGVQGFSLSSEAYFLAKLKETDPNKTIVRITPDGKSAFQLKEDIEFFLDPKYHQDLCHFPAADNLPYTGILPDADFTADRLSTLHRLTHGEPLLILLPISAWLRRLPPRSLF